MEPAPRHRIYILQKMLTKAVPFGLIGLVGSVVFLRVVVVFLYIHCTLPDTILDTKGMAI